VGIASFSHVIVGSVEMFYLVVTAKASLLAVTGGFILPALAGNVVGGIVFVTLLNHLQTVAGGGRKESY
jgi:formate/nitrite transporter FocA (FNT family)